MCAAEISAAEIHGNYHLQSDYGFVLLGGVCRKFIIAEVEAF